MQVRTRVFTVLDIYTAFMPGEFPSITEEIIKEI